MAILTNKADVIANFVRYHGRQPNSEELSSGKLIDYLTTKSPAEVEQLLSKNSPITGGKTWNDYQTSLRMSASTPSSTTNQQSNTSSLNTATLGDNGVNALFKQYYGRNATQEELNYWSQKSDAELRPKLIPNSATELARNKPKESSSTTSEPTSSPMTSESDGGLTASQKAELEKLNSDIDAMDYSTEEKAILKQIASQDFTSGNKIPTMQELVQIVDTAAKNAETDLTPYYEKTSARELEDMKTKMADIRNEAARYAQQEALGYKEKLASTKQSLRSRGLTFSGTAAATLGSEAGVNVPGVEGSLATQRRYDWEDKSASLQERARDVGLAGERLLGSSTLNNAQNELGNIINPYAKGITYDSGSATPAYLVNKQGTSGYVATGDLTLDKIKEIEKSKQERIAKYSSSI